MADFTTEGYLGTPCKAKPEWQLYYVADGLLQLRSIAGGERGRMKYQIPVKPGKGFDKNRNLGLGRLKKDLPDVYAALEVFLKNSDTVTPAASEARVLIKADADKYGDAVIGGASPLTKEQEYNRSLLYMRQQSMEARAGFGPPDRDFTLGVRFNYSAIFQAIISDELLKEAIHFITKGSRDINPSVFLKCVRDYHDGIYRPESCKRLENVFDQLCGTT